MLLMPIDMALHDIEDTIISQNLIIFLRDQIPLWIVGSGHRSLVYYIMFHLVAMDCDIRPSLSSVLHNVPCMSIDDDASPGSYGLWHQAITL